MNARTFLPLFALFGAIGYCYYRGRCAKSAAREIKEDVTRWEGEGGNVPAVATPTPRVVPQPSRPDEVPPPIRH